MAEKLAWADQNGVMPPDSALKAAESSKTKKRSSCCCEHERASDSCCDEENHAKKTVTVKWTMASLNQFCRTGAIVALSVAPSVPPTCPAVFVPKPRVVPSMPITVHMPLSHIAAPDAPPPRVDD
jgi:hypothetical protein